MLVDITRNYPEAEILASTNQPSEITLLESKGLRSIDKQKLFISKKECSPS